MKIFVFPSHQSQDRTSGVDFARLLQPMKHLNSKEIEVTLFDINQKTNWLEVAEKYDAIYFNYLNNPWGYAAMGAMARAKDVKLIMDIDDDIWELHNDNAAQSVYKKGSDALRNFTLICNDVDYITTTNEYLRNVIISQTNKKADRIKVFPNYIDLNLYTYRAPFKNTNQIVLTHFGSTTHFLDLNEYEFFKGVDKIMKEYPNVIFRTVGAFIPKLRQAWGQRYEQVFGHVDIYHWIQDPDKFPKYMSDTDIMVVPLENDVYNRCKSSIKWLEASSAKIPGVWQDIRQYREVIDGTNGLLAKTDKEWYRAIKSLIDNPDKRKQMGEKTFKDVENNWTIQAHIQEYKDFFTEILDK